MKSSNFDWISAHPIAHRALHDASQGRIENSLSAAKAAVDHGYAIEVDLHPSKDGTPMVFHDNVLDRLTDQSGDFREVTTGELQKIRLSGSTDHVPTLHQLLQLVDGRVALILELKGIKGQDHGFVASVLNVLESYTGKVAIMSFDLWLLADARKLGTTLPVGLTAEGDDQFYEAHKAAWHNFDVDFVSYGISDLPNRFVEEFRKSGKPVITWTIRSPEQAEISAKYADQITFEGFLA